MTGIVATYSDLISAHAKIARVLQLSIIFYGLSLPATRLLTHSLDDHHSFRDHFWHSRKAPLTSSNIFSIVIPLDACRNLISQSNGKGPPITAVVHRSGSGHTGSPCSFSFGPSTKNFSKFPQNTSNSASAKTCPGQALLPRPKIWCPLSRGCSVSGDRKFGLDLLSHRSGLYVSGSV
jgi:hypothetical protein